MGELGEPGPDRRERAHKTARAQQLPPRPPARAQKTIEPLLLDLVHVEEPVRRPPVEGAVLDVLADDPGSLLVAAAKKAAAIVQMRRRTAPGPMFMLMIALLCQFASL